jgi:hypothetical protein
MTSKLKCPACGKTELIRMFNPLTGEYFEDYDCPFRLCNFRGNKVAVDTLIQAKQDLEIARKALDKADRFFDGTIGLYQSEMHAIIKTALEQIEHKEVK